jgi:hypothetical protein
MAEDRQPERVESAVRTAADTDSTVAAEQVVSGAA